MKSYREYINEGIRDKMTPKSEEEIREVVKRVVGINDDYIEVKIPEPNEVKKIKSLLDLSDKYNLDIKDYTDNNVIVCGDIIDVFNFIKFYVNYTMINKQNKSEFFIDYIIHNTIRKVTESVKDKMTPKSEEDIRLGKNEIITYIRHIAEVNGGKLTMRKVEVSIDDMPVYDVSKTEDMDEIHHIIDKLYMNEVNVIEYDTWEEKTIHQYRVKYIDLSPETLMDIKFLLEEAISWENIKGK